MISYVNSRLVRADFADAKDQHAAMVSIVQNTCLLDREYAKELGAIARAKVHDEVIFLFDASKNVLHDEILNGKHDP